MKKWLFGFVFCSFLLCLCANACAVEPPVLDYEGFAAHLKEQGITFPQTMEEAFGDVDFSRLPKYELIVDEENDQYILRTDLGEADANIIFYARDMQSDIYFDKTDEPGVYVAKGIGDYTILRVKVPDERDFYVSNLLCYFDLEESGICYSFEQAHFLTETIYVSRTLHSFSDGTGSFTYVIGEEDSNEVRKELELTYRIPTEELFCVEYYESGGGEDSKLLQFYDKSIRQFWFADYDYFPGDGWSKNGVDCDPPFELTLDLYPYPSFVP